MRFSTGIIRYYELSKITRTEYGRKWMFTFTSTNSGKGKMSYRKTNLKPFHYNLTTLCFLSSIGGSLAITGTYVLVTFAPHTSTHITAHLVQYYAISWHFLLYLVCNSIKLSCLSPVTLCLVCVSIFLFSWLHSF